MAKVISKKELSKKVRRLHRSTRSRWIRLLPYHEKLRQRFRWYYKWHAFPYYELVHLAIFLVVLTLFFGLVLNYYKLRNEVKYTKLDYTIVGKKAFSEFEKIVHVEFREGSLRLEEEGQGRYSQMGFLDKKIEISEPVIWQTISWQGDLSSGTKITLRTKGSDVDQEDIWERIPWSSEYISSPSRIIHEGTPSPKSQFLKLEIFLEGDGYNTPSLRQVNLHYLIPPKPNKAVVWIQDKLRRYLPWLFEKIWTKLQQWEGIE